MAQRRMFSKTITNSGKFLKMPQTSRLLYYDLGMNADDDGFCEWFTVMKMSGSAEQDLSVLQANGFVQIFDDNVLIILDWKENNYIQKDRYLPSKYLNVYKMDTICIQNVNTGKDRLGKDRLNHMGVAIAPPQRKILKKKSMKYKDSIIELDELGEPMEKVTVKKTPVKVITAVAIHYADLFNVPKENLFFKYRRAIEEMVTCAKEYYGDDFKKIEEEVKFRITVAKSYADFKGWGKIKLATIAESWNEIPAWRDQIEV